MWKRTLAAALVALITMCGAAQAEPLKLTFSTGSIGGGFFAVGSGIADYISKSVPNVQVTAITAAGVVESINRLEQGKADFAMLNTQDPPAGLGRQSSYPRKYNKMRMMGILYMQTAQPYVLKSSGIRTFKDLKGKVVSVGAPGGTMHLDLFNWMEANGMTKDDLGKILFCPPAKPWKPSRPVRWTWLWNCLPSPRLRSANCLSSIPCISLSCPRHTGGTDDQVSPVPARHPRKGGLQRH